MKRSNDAPEKWPAPSRVRRSVTPPSSPSSSSSTSSSSDEASPSTSSTSPEPAIAAPTMTTANGRSILRPRPPRPLVPVVLGIPIRTVQKNKHIEGVRRIFYGHCSVVLTDIFKFNYGKETKTTPGSNPGKCMFCKVARATHACIPCGHKVLCITCLYNVAFCPICHRAIIERLRIFD